MDIERKKFNRVKQQAEKAYKKLDNIYCPYFDERVNFNAKGLDHIKFKRWNKARTRVDQYTRLKLLYLAPEIIKDSHTLQGYSQSNNMERVKTNNRWEKQMRTVHYYEFIAIIKNLRMRVIVKQVEGGEKFFWSIIPFWRMDKRNNRRLLHSGKPETD